MRKAPIELRDLRQRIYVRRRLNLAETLGGTVGRGGVGSGCYGLLKALPTRTAA